MFQPNTVRDQVRFNTTVASIRQPAFEVINRMQRHTPGTQLTATAVALTVMAEAVGLDPHDLITRAKRMAGPADTPFSPEIGAIREYASNEIGRGVSI